MIELPRVERLADRAPFRQIADHLRAAIGSGKLGPGEQVPSEWMLTQHYGVARMTVRAALRELAVEGLVVAQHGRGVFVTGDAQVRDGDPTLEESLRLAREEIARPGRSYVVDIDTGHLRVLVAELDRTRKAMRALTEALNQATSQRFP